MLSFGWILACAPTDGELGVDAKAFSEMELPLSIAPNTPWSFMLRGVDASFRTEIRETPNNPQTMNAQIHATIDGVVSTSMVAPLPSLDVTIEQPSDVQLSVFNFGDEVLEGLLYVGKGAPMVDDDGCPDVVYLAFVSSFYSVLQGVGSSLAYAETQQLNALLDSKPCGHSTEAFGAWLENHRQTVDGFGDYLDYGNRQVGDMSAAAGPDGGGDGAWALWFDWYGTRLLEMGSISHSEQQVLDLIGEAEPSPDDGAFAAFFPVYMELLGDAGSALDYNEHQLLNAAKAYHYGGILDADYIAWIDAFVDVVGAMGSDIAYNEGQVLSELLTVKPCPEPVGTESEVAYMSMMSAVPASARSWVQTAGPTCN